MFDIGATEVLVLAVVAIVVVGPRDLPKMLRTIGQFVGKARSMAREFQQHFNDAADEAGLDEVRKGIASVEETARSGDFSDSFSSFSDADKDLKDEMEKPIDMDAQGGSENDTVSSNDAAPADGIADLGDNVSNNNETTASDTPDENGSEFPGVSTVEKTGKPTADSDDLTEIADGDADAAETPAKTVAS